MALNVQTLKKIMIDYDLATAEQMEDLVECSSREKVPLDRLLVLRGVIKEQNLGQLIADYLAIPFVYLKKKKIDSRVLKLIPEAYATEKKVIVFEDFSDYLSLGMVDPSDKKVLRTLSRKFKKNLKVHYAGRRDIEETLLLYKKGIEDEFKSLIKKHIEEAEKASEGLERSVVEVPVIKIVDTLIRYAYNYRASDIHIEPQEDKVVVRFRVDGVLHDVLIISGRIHKLIISRIKVIAGLRTDEHMAAQDGKFRVSQRGDKIDLRVSIIPIVEGEKVVLRLLSERIRDLGLQELGLSDNCRDIVKKAIKMPHGMILATGPTGSGKTTTLYAILKILNSREINISSIEDPVEYDIRGVNQVQSNTRTGLTFATGLRSLMRQDPDVIMVGEIRDKDTAGISVNASLTGHLVLSSLHTNDATTTIARLVDMGVEPFLVASTVNIAIGQRLVRRICPKCIASYSAKNEIVQLNELVDLNKILGRNPQSLTLYKGKGCLVCNGSGYFGRIGVFEIMEMTENVKSLVLSKANASQVRKKAIENGMITILEDGVLKAINGITTVEEVLRVAGQ